ncbi:hypothetical protein TNCV_1453681 [Trichonephila clavipes]|nr:hypothetical protein TNCV_1453681 [Trichonephila clavipes]
MACPPQLCLCKRFSTLKQALVTCFILHGERRQTTSAGYTGSFGPDLIFMDYVFVIHLDDNFWKVWIIAGWIREPDIQT